MLRLIAALCLVTQALACSPRTLSTGIVCVCNSTYCDTVPQLGDIKDNLKLYHTSSSEAGFNTKDVSFTASRDPAATVVSIQKDRLQKILGFGGAFTDAASLNILKLSDGARQKLLESYFGDDGIEYTICRVNLGACDFSTRLYTLDDSEEDDPELKNFQLQDEDLNFKIPVMLQAQSIRGNKSFNVFASAWTSPLWMKDRKAWVGGSMLQPKYYQAWADYHLKFFDGYLEKGIKFWGMTLGNEPSAGFVSNGIIPSLGWDTDGQAQYLVNNLGPTIRNSTSHKDLKIMVLDENLGILPFMTTPLLGHNDTLQYIDGVAVHWYGDGNTYMATRLLPHNYDKDIFVLKTEACHFQVQPILGNWDRASKYLSNIYDDLEYGYAGWVEWNLALNISGGPTQINWPADAPIILSEDYSEFYKQPMFYAIGHFSKFVSPDSVRLNTTQEGTGVRTLAFLRPDGLKAVLLFNSGGTGVTVQIEDEGRYSASLSLSPWSINTLLYNSS